VALVTAAEYKASRGIAGTDFDTRIGEAINAASAKIRSYCGRDLSDGFEEAARTEVYSGDGTSLIRLAEWPVASIASVKMLTAASSGAAVYGDTVEASAYFSDGRGALYRVGGLDWAWTHEGSSRVAWPEGSANVQVVYTAGYSTIPDAIKEAVFSLMDQWFGTAGRNALSTMTEAMGVVNRGEATAFEVNARIADMLSPWRRVYA
jgi:hypothetical protein